MGSGGQPIASLGELSLQILLYISTEASVSSLLECALFLSPKQNNIEKYKGKGKEIQTFSEFIISN